LLYAFPNPAIDLQTHYEGSYPSEQEHAVGPI